MKAKIIVLFSLLMLMQYGFAQNLHDADFLRIEAMTNKCTDNHPSTQGTAKCYMQEQKEWDKVLNKYYNLLKNELSKKGKKALLDVQREWIKMRDKEFAFIDQFYLVEMSGSMYFPIAQGAKSEIVKKRALRLKDYYEEYFE